MKTYTERSGDILRTLVDWQAVETGTVEYANNEIPKARNPLTRTILTALKLEAEKHCAIQQMIVESIKKEAVHLSPEELQELSGHLNRQLEVEEKTLSHVEAAAEKNDLFIPGYLLTYLIADVKKQIGLLRQFDDELKTASIPTSVTSKKFASSRAA